MQNQLNMLKPLFTFPIKLGQQVAIARREFFFQQILNVCSDPPDAAALLMGQDVYFVKPDASKAAIDAEKGVLVFDVPAKFFGIDCRHTYSLYQIGDLLKIGLLLGNGLERAPLVDWHREMSEIWPGVEYQQHDRAECTLYEWIFRTPALYDNWTEQEFFIYGMRHCKQRMLRVIYDFANLLASGEEKKE